MTAGRLPYARLALTHGASVVIALAAVAGALWLRDVRVLGLGLFAEALWIGFASLAPWTRRAFDAKHREATDRVRVLEEQKQLRGVSEADRRRFLELEKMRLEVHRLSGSNQSLALEMVQPELIKLDRLVRSFLQLAVKASRYETYRETSPDRGEGDVVSEIARVEAELARETDPSTRALAARNLELLERRANQGAEVAAQLKQARGEMALIENTVRLLRDQIGTMDSISSVAGELDALIQSVDAIESGAREVESLTQSPKRLPTKVVDG